MGGRCSASASLRPLSSPDGPRAALTGLVLSTPSAKGGVPFTKARPRAPGRLSRGDRRGRRADRVATGPARIPPVLCGGGRRLPLRRDLARRRRERRPCGVAGRQLTHRRGQRRHSAGRGDRLARRLGGHRGRRRPDGRQCRTTCCTARDLAAGRPWGCAPRSRLRSDTPGVWPPGRPEDARSPIYLVSAEGWITRRRHHVGQASRGVNERPP